MEFHKLQMPSLSSCCVFVMRQEPLPYRSVSMFSVRYYFPSSHLSVSLQSKSEYYYCQALCIVIDVHSDLFAFYRHHSCHSNCGFLYVREIEREKEIKKKSHIRNPANSLPICVGVDIILAISGVTTMP